MAETRRKFDPDFKEGADTDRTSTCPVLPVQKHFSHERPRLAHSRRKPEVSR